MLIDILDIVFKIIFLAAINMINVEPSRFWL